MNRIGYRTTEVTADMLKNGDRFGQRVVKSARLGHARQLVFVTFADGTSSTYDKNTVFRIKRPKQ